MVDKQATIRPPPRPRPRPFPAPEELQAPEVELQAPSRRSRVRATVWTVLGLVLATALQYLLESRGVPAPIVEDAARLIQDALPK